ncbi:MAG: hypothetical protein E6R03_09140 [Hyphomicrobiaceae bacterium]|nr:MAG: hypothetical protein E6R03_09140 [Hyphomicrobiaceae bacterium]
MSSWHSYPRIFTLGHRAIATLFEEPVVVEEKVDGSQFSFGVFDGELRIRSKGVVMPVDAPEKMFNKAAVAVKDLYAQGLLTDGWTYRGEYLQKPKHNALAYDRVPTNHIILFDVCTAEETYLSYDEKAAEAARLGLEVVPRLGVVQGDCLAELRTIIDNTVSVLGGQKIEGVVCKQAVVTRFGPDKKALIGKFVSEAFKEVHKASWGEANLTSGDVLVRLGETYRNASRWRKAIEHLRDAGRLTDSPKDIGLLMAEVPTDIRKECEDDIKDALFKWAWPHLARQATRGLPEFYKDELLKQQFQGD